MARWDVTKVILLAMGLCLCWAHTTAKPKNSTEKPHIVLILADDLGWNDISWNNPMVLSPHLETLAREGVILDQSYVQPICTPTRSALMTGRYPYTLGTQHKVLRPREPTGLSKKRKLLSEAMKEAGYSTHIVGKWHLGFCSWDYTPTSRGFDTFWGYYVGSEDYYNHTRKDDATQGYDFRNNTKVEYSVTGEYSTYSFTSYTVDLLESRNPEEPMFLYLPFQSVHGPLQVPRNYTKPFARIKDKDRRIKLGMVLAMDEAVGRIVEALKSSGHFNNTIIIFSTDNGGPTSVAGNNWPLRGRKATLWEGGTRGPAFVHSPLLSRKGVVSHELIHVTDWFPTIAALGGGVAPEDTHGYDQWTSISTGAPSPRVEMVYNIDMTEAFKAGIRMGDYKLLLGDPGEGEWTPPPEGFNATQGQGDDSHQRQEEEEETEEGIPHDVTTQPDQSLYNERTTGNDGPRGDKSSRLRRSPEEPLVVKMGVDVFEGVGKEATEEPDIMTFNERMDSYPPDVLWKDVDNSVTLGELNFDFSHFRILEDFLSNETKVRLFHVMGDPDERINVAKDQPDVVQILMNILQLHLKDYVKADIPPEDPAGAPRHWNNTWSPGWCKAK